MQKFVQKFDRSFKFIFFAILHNYAKKNRGDVKSVNHESTYDVKYCIKPSVCVCVCVRERERERVGIKLKLQMARRERLNK
jgi:hypothetical protein